MATFQVVEIDVERIANLHQILACCRELSAANPTYLTRIYARSARRFASRPASTHTLIFYRGCDCCRGESKRSHRTKVSSLCKFASFFRLNIPSVELDKQAASAAPGHRWQGTSILAARPYLRPKNSCHDPTSCGGRTTRLPASST